MSRRLDDQKVHVEIIKGGYYLLVKEDGTVSNGPFSEGEFHVRSVEARTIRDYAKHLGRPIPEMVKAVLEYNGELDG